MVKACLRCWRGNANVSLLSPSLDTAGLAATSRQCRRRSCDVVLTSGSRGRRLSTPPTFSSPAASGVLFGRPLEELCQRNMPRPLSQMMSVLYDRGPQANGVFRRSANYTKCQAAKQTLDAGRQFHFDNVPLAVTASLLKEFLRCLPDCLLSSHLYENWLDVADIDDPSQASQQIKHLVECLAASHELVLRSLMIVLRRISDNSATNEMTSYNLAACIGQNLLWPSSGYRMSIDDHLAAAKRLNLVVEKMINGAYDIFGSDSFPAHLKTNYSLRTANRCRNIASSDALVDDDKSSSPSEDSTSSVDCPRSSSCESDIRRHSFPLLRIDRRSLRLANTSIASDSQSSIANSVVTGRRSGLNFSSDSGSNSFSSETSQSATDQTTDTGTPSSDDYAPARRKNHSAQNHDSGSQQSTKAPTTTTSNNFDILFHVESNPQSEQQSIINTGVEEYKRSGTASGNITATESADDSGHRAWDRSSAIRSRSLNVEQFEKSAIDRPTVPGIGRVARRGSLGSLAEPEDTNKARRRRSFMMPNGSSFYPTRFSASFAWQTIVEEGFQLPDESTQTYQVDCAADATKASESENDLMVDNDYGGSFANLRSLRSALASPDPAGKNSHGPPSYDEALLHKKLRSSELSDVERVATLQKLAALRRRSEPLPRMQIQSSLMTSSTSGEIPVVAGTCTSHCMSSECDNGESAQRWPPPPPYYLRPRRRDLVESDEFQPANANEESILNVNSVTTQPRKIHSDPLIQVDKSDRVDAIHLRRQRSYPSLKRRCYSDEKENIAAIKSPSNTSDTSNRSSSVSEKNAGAGDFLSSPIKTSRIETRSRRSLTVRDRDWHRELIHQYSDS